MIYFTVKLINGVTCLKYIKYMATAVLKRTTKQTFNSLKIVFSDTKKLRIRLNSQI